VIVAYAAYVIVVVSLHEIFMIRILSHPNARQLLAKPPWELTKEDSEQEPWPNYLALTLMLTFLVALLVVWLA
jgi:hypothetical protein